MAEHAMHAFSEAAAPLAAPMRCKLWNWDTLGICLVFPSLQITSTPTLFFYLFFRYNAYLIAAVLTGSFLGHFYATRNFDLYAGGLDDDKIGGACH
ncbi:hypothetical protein RQP46_008834 [Phenoliferia psychrophenolica]